MLRNLTLGIASLAVATIAVFTPVVSATQGNPAGNNGTIKINDGLKPDDTPNNNPHVKCEFSVEFYNYDEGNYNAEVKFDLHNPTKDGRTVEVVSGDQTPFIGEDAAGGGKDIDASEVYKLNFTGEPHSKQGYHVKLTVYAPNSKGSDKKHKVFWVKPCDKDEQPSQKPGEVLGDNDNKGGADQQPKGGADSPKALPVTGGEVVPAAAAGILTSGVAYAAHYRRSKR